jgi:hypothetical protein
MRNRIVEHAHSIKHGGASNQAQPNGGLLGDEGLEPPAILPEEIISSRVSGAKSGAAKAQTAPVRREQNRTDEPPVDRHLARLVSRWQSLDEVTRTAIMRLVDSAR